MDDMATTTDTRLYGTSETGCWVVYSDSDDQGSSWGPFSSRSVVKVWIESFGRTDLYAVNLSDHPNWWNV